MTSTNSVSSFTSSFQSVQQQRHTRQSGKVIIDLSGISPQSSAAKKPAALNLKVPPLTYDFGPAIHPCNLPPGDDDISAIDNLSVDLDLDLSDITEPQEHQQIARGSVLQRLKEQVQQLRQHRSAIAKVLQDVQLPTRLSTDLIVMLNETQKQIIYVAGQLRSLGATEN